jgi:long-chain acyl-CoA synthetase
MQGVADVREPVRCGRRELSFMSFNLATLLRESAKTHPDKTAILYDGGAISYAELDRLSDRFAVGLREHGLAPRDAIGLQLPNIPQFVIAYFGILKAGCVAVPMNVMLKAPETAYQLGNSHARALITWAGIAEEGAKATAAVGIAELFVVNTPGTPPSTVGHPAETLLENDPSLTAPFEQVDPGDTAVIVYTSGTTGTPKGAELTHFQLLMNAEIPGRLFGVREDDVVVVVLPLFHVFGLSSQLNVCVRFAATMSLVVRFDPAKVIEVIRRDRVTIFEGVPTMYFALLNHPGITDDDVTSLRIGISGGAAIPAEILDAFEKKFGVLILEGYGLTETASTTTFNISARDRKVYSVGKPIWGVEVEVWDDEEKVLAPGEPNVGEIMVRGVNVMRGYYDDPEATAAAFTRGWLHTGDLGYLDKEGFLFIVDRKKDLIIRGGYNVYPREIEEVLYTHPQIAEAAVVGIADPRLGEEVKAFITTRPGSTVSEQDLIDYVRERVAAYKYPRHVEFRAQMPHGATGKILKQELR